MSTSASARSPFLRSPCLACRGRRRRGWRAGRAGTGDEHFKYGSVGIESEEGIPYWIWQVLPQDVPGQAPGPGGYASLGFIWEPGRELPIGFSKKDVLGSTRIAVNCAFCHTATYRTAPGAPRSDRARRRDDDR